MDYLTGHSNLKKYIFYHDFQPRCFVVNYGHGPSFSHSEPSMEIITQVECTTVNNLNVFRVSFAQSCIIVARKITFFLPGED